jgi:hypothetical protein
VKCDWVKVNLNQRVRVNLTEEGKRTLLSHYAESGVAMGSGIVMGFRLPVEMQLWELMGIFGSCLQSSGTSTPFEKNTIEIQEGIL